MTNSFLFLETNVVRKTLASNLNACGDVSIILSSIIESSKLAWVVAL